MYKSLYSKAKRDYVSLTKTNTKTRQYGGDIDEQTYERSKFHNLYYYFDKGSNNLWTEPVVENKSITIGDQNETITNVTSTQFDEYLTKTMADRYHARISALKNLMNVMQVGGDEVTNLDFLEKFYHYLFKGTAFKRYFPEPEAINEDIKKRFKIFVEWDEGDKNAKRLPKKKYYVFTDNPNPCHLIKIMKDEFGRGDSNENSTKYGFVNVKELGRGKAGTASLFQYYGDQTKNNKLMIAAKLMGSSQFTLTNGGKYLPLEIGYVSGDHKKETTYYKESGSTFKDYRNTRFLYTPGLASYIDSYCPKYSMYNVFDVEKNNKYTQVFLSVSSDNFSNQTIMHMILEMILSNPELAKISNDGMLMHSYIKQYDAMLCYNTVSNFDKAEGSSWLDVLKENASSALDYVGKSLNLLNPQIDGLNFMEVADAGDLHGHLFTMQKNVFPKVRSVEDLENPDLFGRLNEFLSEMIKQLLRPLSILQHPKYAFIHGDLKTKNVFVKNDGKKFIYKLADYDKSSISFNGIRFYNSGNAVVKKIMNTIGPKRYDNYTFGSTDTSNVKANINIDSLNEDEIKGISLTPNYDSIRDIVSAASINEKEKASIIYAYIIEKLKQSQSGGVKEELTELFRSSPIVYAELHSLIRTVINYISKGDVNKPKSDIGLNDAIGILEKIITENKDVNLNVFYRLTSLLTYASLFVTGLERVEIEQMYVRYQPFPFFHTIDLYTLFLSLLQSPMVHVFLKYCIANKDNDVVKKSVFWNSFYDLWVDDNDVYTILGYYDYLFEGAEKVDIEIMATIGFILDPIKKNEINLVRCVADTYWDRVWDGKYQPIKQYIGSPNKPSQGAPSKAPHGKLELSESGEFDQKRRTVNLSSDQIFSFTMPNIALSKCGTFDMRFFREGKSYYVNKNIVVYGVPNIGEKTSVIFGSKQSQGQLALRKTYKDNVRTNVLRFVQAHQTDIVEGKIYVRGFEKGEGIGSEDAPDKTAFVPDELPVEQRAETIMRNEDSDDHKKIMQAIWGNLHNIKLNPPATIPYQITDTIPKVYYSTWTHKYYLKDIPAYIVNTIIAESFQYMDPFLRHVFAMFAKEKYTPNEVKSWEGSQQQVVTLIKDTLSKIDEVWKSYLASEQGENDMRRFMEAFTEYKEKELSTMAEQHEQKYAAELKKRNEEKKIFINQKNIQAEKEWVARNAIKSKSSTEKYNRLIENLSKEGHGGLDPYIEAISQGSSETAFRTLQNVCKTNTYKDAFYNIQNWDYCSFPEDEILSILKNYNLL